MEDWIELKKGIELNGMNFEYNNDQPRRYILVKKRVIDRPKASGILLFEDMPGYRYSCYVTNLDLPLDQIWNIYNSRADCENRTVLKIALPVKRRPWMTGLFSQIIGLSPPFRYPDA